MAERIIGFSTHALKFLSEKKGRGEATAEAIDIVRKIGCNAVQICATTQELIDDLEKIVSADLTGMRHVSIRAPVECLPDDSSRPQIFAYDGSAAANGIMRRLERISQDLGAQLIVYRPDTVTVPCLFRNPEYIAAENTDPRMATGSRAWQVRDFMRFQGVGKFCFNVRGAYCTYLRSQRKAEVLAEFCTDQYLGERLAEVHISSASRSFNVKTGVHAPTPLYRSETHRDGILALVPKRSDLPIILDAEVRSMDEAKKEFAYVNKTLNQ